MAVVKEEILRRLEQLPEPKLYEVLTFVEFLAWKLDEPAQDPLLAVLGSLSGDPMTSDEIELTLYGENVANG